MPQLSDDRWGNYVMRDVRHVAHVTHKRTLASVYGGTVPATGPNQRFAALLREARKKAGLDQEDVAEQSGVSLSTYGRWENGNVGNPKPRQVLAVCEVLGLNTVAAGIALGYVAEQDTEPLPEREPLDPTVEEIIALFRRGDVGDDDKFAALRYLRFLASESAEPGPDKQTRAS